MHFIGLRNFYVNIKKFIVRLEKNLVLLFYTKREDLMITWLEFLYLLTSYLWIFILQTFGKGDKYSSCDHNYNFNTTTKKNIRLVCR